MRSNKSWIALLRGVNVGGGNKVPMAELRKLCEGLGWCDVRSYIASGNLIFNAKDAAGDLSNRLRTAMAEQMGVDVPILILPAATVAKALEDCPFNPEQGSACHIFFLWHTPILDWDAYRALRVPGEDLQVDGRRAWLHTPGGFGRSRLAERLPKVITGTEMTGRNLNTLRKLVELSA
jgi:uncharacterized protein (DUF1697 family)